MSYSPSNNYNQRIVHYESLLDSIGDLDKVDIPTDDDNEKEVRGIQKGIDSTVKSVKDIAYDLLSIVQQEVSEALSLALDNYVELINATEVIDDFDTFPFREWLEVAEFKNKKTWNINKSWINPIRYIKADTDHKREIVLLNVLQYWQEYKLNNELRLSEGLKDVKIFLDLFKDEKISNFYEHMLYGSPLEYIVELRGDIPKANLNKWNQEAFLNLSLVWSSVDKRNVVLENYEAYLKTNPDSKNYLNNLFMDVFFNKSFNGDKTYVNVVERSNDMVLVENISYDKILDFVHLDIKHKFEYHEILIDKLTYLDKLWKYTTDRTEGYKEFISVATPIYLSAKLEDKLENKSKGEKKVKI